MKIKLTKDQYKNLVELVYLGNWMINAIRIGDNTIKKYQEIEQYIFSFAKKGNLEQYIEFDNKFNKFFPTAELEDNTDIEQYRQDYDNEVFWQELSDRLGSRDFIKKYGVDKIKKMDRKQRFIKGQEFIIKYEREFEKYGIDRLNIENKNTT